MKKIVSIVVTMLLVVGLYPMLAVNASWPGHLHSPVIGFSGPTNTVVMMDDDKVADFDRIVLGKDNMNLVIPVYHNMFDYDGQPEDLHLVTQAVMNNCPLEFKYAKAPSNGNWVRIPPSDIFVADYERSPGIGGAIPQYTLTAQKTGAVDMEVRMLFLDPTDQSVREYSDTIKVVGEYLDPTINKTIIDIVPLPLDRGRVMIDDSTVTDRSVLKNMVIEPGAVIRMKVNTDFFDWAPDIFDMAYGVRRATLDNDKVAVEKHVVNGSGIIKSIGFENFDGNAEITIRFIDDFSNVKEKEFDFTVYLAKHGVRKIGTATRIMGTFGNYIHEVSEDNDYVFVGDGTIAEATRNCRNVRLELGEGLVVTANLIEGTKYYGKATTELDEDARAIMNYFTDIKKTVRVNAVNIRNRAQFATFIDQEQNYYVYDEDGVYLGRSEEKLEFRERYYLSAKEIDFAAGLEQLTVQPTEEKDEIEDFDEFSENPTTGGNSGAPLAVAGVIGLAVLSAGLYIASKKKENDED